MHIDSNTKYLQKAYCRTLLASEGKLTRSLYDRIEGGDELTIRGILESHKLKIVEIARTIENSEDRIITLTQADSVQEVIDRLPQILNA